MIFKNNNNDFLI